jgi:methionine-rich copper-binding protein CopC
VLRAGGDVDLEMGVAFEGVVIADGEVHVKKDSQLTFLALDEEPPVITLVTPEDGAVLDTSPAEIVAEWSDDFSGVDPATASILLDGVDRTAEATVSETGLTLAVSEALADGTHTVEIAVSDFSGKQGTGSFSFEVDTGPDLVPPDLTIVSPADGAQLNDSPKTIELAFADADSGIDPDSLRLFLDEIDLSTACDLIAGGASCLIFQVPVGGHQIDAEIRDLEGNAGTAGAEFTLIRPGTAPVIEITAPEPGTLTNAEVVTVSGRVFTTGTIVELTVNDLPVALTGDSFQLEIPIAEGPFGIVVRAVDGDGREAVEQTEIEVDRTPPELIVQQPADGQLSNVGEVRVSGSAADDLGFAEVTVQGIAVALNPVAFETTVSLAEGSNEITIVARDRTGNEVTREIGVDYQPALEVTITQPPDQLQATADTVTVVGTVTGDPTEVTVAGLAATLAGGAFSADVPLVLGSNPIAVVARDAGGRIGKAVVTVLRDTSAPRIVFTAPTDGQVVYEPTIDVSGLINDVIGTAAPAAYRFTVTINGLPAEVEGDSFSLAGIALQPGVNTLTATAVDESGNQGEASVAVRFETAASPRLLRISGSGQAATIGSGLTAPLVARAVDGGGQPVASAPVVFRVTEGNGKLGSGERQAVVFTGADGLAAIGFEVGTRAGRGNQVVEATAVGFAGTARFFLDALPGEATDLVVDTGTQQLGITGQRLPEPLVAIAVDAAFNPLPGLPVTFQVVAGGGHFENGPEVLEVTTDAKGQAIATLILGPEEGEVNNAVVARLGPADPEPPEDMPSTAFVASAMAIGSGPTTIGGVVLDNTDQPVPGVTLKIAGTTVETTADSQGIFVFEDVPAGTLRLEVDGGTATRPGTWPHLAFVLQAIPGRDNELPRPIYLLPLDTEGVFVSETEGGTLTLPELPGLELEVAPGSATFPDGSRSGVVSVTVVHSDKVPMIPSFFQQPRLVITVQPSGTLFDPPARLSLPNLDGREPGEVVDFFSFDHDLARFVSIGPAQVTEDGTAIRSKPGFGIVEGGWHCGENPSGTGTPNKCLEECEECDKDTKMCVPKDPCTACGEEGDGRVCDGEEHCVAGSAMIDRICDQIGVSDSGLMQIPRTDPLVQEKLGCLPSYCYVGARLTFTTVTHDCNGADLRGATLTESLIRTGGNCNIGIIASRGCLIRRGNKPMKTATEPCTDTWAACGPPDLIPIGGCTATFEQTLRVGSCVAEHNSFTFSIPRGTTGCGPGTVGSP